MRREIQVFACGVLATLGTALASEHEPPKPGPQHQELGYFTGKWTTEGDMKPGPLGPGGKMSSQDNCEWFAGKYQVVCRGSGKGPMGSITTMGIIGYDAANEKYTYYGIDSFGMADLSSGIKDGGTWTFSSKWQMGEESLNSRFTIVEQSPTAYTFKWETSPDGTNWSTLMEGKSTKQK